MTVLIYAILTCTTGSGGACLDNYPLRFHSAQECLTFMTHNMGRGRELTNGRAYANNSHSVWFECDEKPTSEWQTVQPQPPQPIPQAMKSYTIATCFKNEADAKVAAGSGWRPGDAPCIQMQPVIHETKTGCLTILFKDATTKPTDYDLDAGEARVYLHGQSRDMWMQCYDTRK
jgi:hypothetical protein